MNTLITRSEFKSQTCLFFINDMELNKINIRNITNKQKFIMLANAALNKRSELKARIKSTLSVNTHFTEFNDTLSIRVEGKADWFELLKILRTYNKNIELGKQYDGYQTFYYYGNAQH